MFKKISKHLLTAFVFSSAFSSFSQDIYFASPKSKINPVKNIDLQLIGGPTISKLNSRYEVGVILGIKKTGTFLPILLKTEAYISVDSILSSNDVLIYSYTQQSLNATDCSSGCSSADSPTTSVGLYFDCNNNLESGNYYVIVKLDADNILKETNETNNVGYFAFQYTKFNCGIVNIRFQNPKSNYSKGEKLNSNNLKVSFENTSSENYSYPPTPQSPIYLSTDLLIDNNDILISKGDVLISSEFDTFCSNPRPFLVSANSYSSYFDNTFTFCPQVNISIPNTISDGKYYILPQLDLRPFIKYTSEPIQIGNITTELESDILTNITRSLDIERAFDLTGREIDVNNTTGQLLIVTLKNGARKIMYFE